MRDPYEIRFSNLEDRKFLSLWVTDEDKKWYPFADDEEMEKFFDNWIGFSKYNASITVTLDAVPVAIATLYLMPYRKISHFAILWMLASPDHRDKDLLHILIRNALHLAKSHFGMDHINVEAFEGSPLIETLQECGFELCTRHKNYARIDGQFHDRLVYIKYDLD